MKDWFYFSPVGKNFFPNWRKNSGCLAFPTAYISVVKCHFSVLKRDFTEAKCLFVRKALLSMGETLF